MPDSEMLSEDEVRALPEGTWITVIWSGGNGPHDYELVFNHQGEPYAWAKNLDHNGNLKFYNPLTFIGKERYHTRVWIAGA